MFGRLDGCSCSVGCSGAVSCRRSLDRETRRTESHQVSYSEHNLLLMCSKIQGIHIFAMACMHAPTFCTCIIHCMQLRGKAVHCIRIACTKISEACMQISHLKNSDSGYVDQSYFCACVAILNWHAVRYLITVNPDST